MGRANKLGMAEQRMLQIGGRLVWKHVQAYPGQVALFKGLVQYVQILDQCIAGKSVSGVDRACRLTTSALSSNSSRVSNSTSRAAVWAASR